MVQSTAEINKLLREPLQLYTKTQLFVLVLCESMGVVTAYYYWSTKIKRRNGLEQLSDRKYAQKHDPFCAGLLLVRHV